MTSMKNSPEYYELLFACWHAGLMAAPSAGPITYMLDGKQYLLVAAGDSLYTFTVNQPVQ